MFATLLAYQSHCTLSNIRGKRACLLVHGSILSRIRASTQFGAVQCRCALIRYEGRSHRDCLPRVAERRAGPDRMQLQHGVSPSRRITGTDGILETTFVNSPPQAGPPEIHLRRGVSSTTPQETIVLPGDSGLLAETERFVRAVRPGREPWNGSTEAESVDTIATLEAIARSIRSGTREPGNPGTRLAGFTSVQALQAANRLLVLLAATGGGF
ncbi:hypothetical protein [Burkholderia diffusa]|uniref:hypothetical protein n=2 Tax=Burkholderia TaxID=32008 RepID=UPI0015815F8C|nr:hypothetical protein [Burkholderia diffusa]